MVEMIQPASLSQDTIATATPTSPGVVSASTAIADDSHTTGISSEQSFAQASPHVNKSAFAADVLAEATELRVTTPNGPSSSPQIAPIPIAFVHTGTHFAVSDSLIQEQEQDQVLRCPRETLSLGNTPPTTNNNAQMTSHHHRSVKAIQAIEPHAAKSPNVDANAMGNDPPRDLFQHTQSNPHLPYTYYAPSQNDPNNASSSFCSSYTDAHRHDHHNSDAEKKSHQLAQHLSQTSATDVPFSDWAQGNQPRN